MSGGATPGPWAIFPHYCKEDSESIYAQTWLIGLGQFDTIAEVRPGHDAFDEQNDANARLIAAAPELLEVARMVAEASELSGVNGPLANAARAAIAKATGAA